MDNVKFPSDATVNAIDTIVKYVLFRVEESNVCVANGVMPLLITIVNPLAVSNLTDTETEHVVDVDIVFGMDRVMEELPFGKLRCCTLGSPEILVNVAHDCVVHEGWSFGNPEK